MINLKQKTDLILMYYLLSIKNKDELIDYIKNYLGNSEEILNFANEFIKMKNNMNSIKKNNKQKNETKKNKKTIIEL
jgi:hypothetical protein